MKRYIPILTLAIISTTYYPVHAKYGDILTFEDIEKKRVKLASRMQQSDENSRKVIEEADAKLSLLNKILQQHIENEQYICSLDSNYEDDSGVKLSSAIERKLELQRDLNTLYADYKVLNKQLKGQSSKEKQKEATEDDNTLKATLMTEDIYNVSSLVRDGISGLLSFFRTEEVTHSTPATPSGILPKPFIQLLVSYLRPTDKLSLSHTSSVIRKIVNDAVTRQTHNFRLTLLLNRSGDYETINNTNNYFDNVGGCQNTTIRLFADFRGENYVELGSFTLAVDQEKTALTCLEANRPRITFFARGLAAFNGLCSVTNKAKLVTVIPAPEVPNISRLLTQVRMERYLRVEYVSSHQSPIPGQRVATVYPVNVTEEVLKKSDGRNMTLSISSNNIGATLPPPMQTVTIERTE